MSNKTIKSVSFNKTNADDARILKAVRRRNFSGFVKKALHAYLDVLESNKEDVATIIESDTEEVFVEDIEEEKPLLTTQERLSQLKQGVNGPTLFH